MNDLFVEPADATPLTIDEQSGLKPSWITTRADLNEAEQDNILKGYSWARRRRLTPLQIATDEFSRTLHKRMFEDVWNWAGQYRLTNKNLGFDWHRVPAESANLFDHFRYWIAHETYSHHELGVRFHHQLVSIHPFPNGNGRHSRMMADLLTEKLGSPSFMWGQGNLGDEGALRRRYIDALHDADAGDYGALLAFAQS